MLLIFGSIEAQDRKAYRKQAESAFAKGNYAEAYHNYQVLVQNTKDSSDIDILYGAAQSARKMDAFLEAELYYQKVLEHPDFLTKPETKFFLAVAKKHNMDYAQAGELFDEIEQNSDDLLLKDRARKEAEITEWALEQMVNGKSINEKHYGEEVNSPYADFSPFPVNGELLYTSVTGIDPDIHPDDLKPVTRILKYSETTEKTLAFPAPTDENLHAANFVTNADGSRKYINYCTQKSENDFHCKLYYFVSKADGTEEAVPMPDFINNDTFTTTEPAVGIDEQGNEVVYFVSNRPGGVGGFDIWFTTCAPDGTYSQPENLSALNTVGDDVTPFFHHPSKTLFFATNGRKSMGGFDIYKSTWRVDNWSEPEHMGFPINNGYDDVHFAFDSDNAMGYYVSNRPGCLCSSPDKVCKCNDIYSYAVTVDVNALVFNQIGETDLAGAAVALIDTETGEIVNRLENFDGNNFNFPLSLERNYRLVASKEGWASDSIEFNTQGIFFPKTIEQKLNLQPSIKLEVLVFDALTNEPLKNANVNFAEADGANAIEKNNETGHDFYYDLAFAKNYKITASKEGYTEGGEIVTTIDLSTPQVIRKEIYLNPFAGELVLYFDNDYPKYPRNPTNTDTTRRSYGETFDAYYAKKDIFVREYSKGRPANQKAELDKAMDDFFEDEIKRNYAELNKYCRMLELYLASNPTKKLEVLMEGFASPLAKSDYNIHLTNRRIVCVINHFRNYNNGILSKYIEGTEKRLHFTTIANGENKSPEVDDNRANPQESIFSRKASIERRVQISEIREYRPGVSWLKNEAETPSGKGK